MKVFIATPTISGDLCHEYTLSLLAGTKDLHNAGIDYQVEFRAGCSLIQLARNELVDMFLKTDCTDLLFIDADLCFQVDAMRKVLLAPKDVVCGLYPYKQDEEKYPARVIQEADGRTKIVNGLVQVSGAPTGFMRIRRWVIERMIEAYPERVFDNGAGPMYDLFPVERVGKELVGEDFRFCQLWREIGGEVWIDPDISFLHVGRRAFPGNWQKYMINLAGEIQ